jgi:hypothetical protein
MCGDMGLPSKILRDGHGLRDCTPDDVDRAKMRQALVVRPDAVATPLAAKQHLRAPSIQLEGRSR